MLDEFHKHEALDRCDIVLTILEMTLLLHPYIEAHPELVAKLEQASDLIGQVYQEIGGRE